MEGSELQQRLRSFKLKQYSAASKLLKNRMQCELLSKELRRDLYLRLGILFANKQYWPAMETYNKAIALDPVKSNYAVLKSNILWVVCRNNKNRNTKKSG